MKLLCALLAALLGLALAHDNHGPHIPKALGGRKLLSRLEARKRAMPREHAVTGRQYGPASPRGKLEARQVGPDDTRCGPGSGSCASGYCCSAEGWCGKGQDYCTAPDCQIDYGPGCDANQKPSGADTSGIARPKLGNVLYGGAGIYDCVNKGDIALTFDDGPYIYTNDLLDILKSYGAKATFFITGTNLGKGKINDPSTVYPAIIRRMHAEGHQIASHTWSHQNASQLTNTQFTNQMVWNEIALNSILGFFPTYMRPPYSICERNCQTVLSRLGYHAIYFDLDTEGYLHDSRTQIQTSKDIWDEAVDGSDPEEDSFLQIEHDIHYQTVYNLTDYVLTSLFSMGYRSVTVGECLGDPAANWYRAGPSGSISSVVPPGSSTSATSKSASTPTRTTVSVAPTRTGVSTNGRCGNGVTCAGARFGPCCSAFGYCGSGDDYCSLDNGCQAAWGSCDGDGTDGTTTVIATRSSTIVKSTNSKSTSSAQPTQTGGGGLAISTDGLCGPEVRQTCTGSMFGRCCSSEGKCSSNTISCRAILGCQKDYGSCV
ncbi:uncharacterized protein B0T15DRAFT_294021 [Chaetomium strumarium]|uniref:Chitin binding protein n=1 Tax=Chaetomium strumarium TaxID=1170767 RepID=A0AAJ0LY92_9PEZI|nr:hypothetical protein B0T15DRAFT_294021 [Chaetomium strumarium]